MANALSYAAPLITENFILSACDNLVPTEDVARVVAMMDGEEHANAVLTLMPVEPDRLGSVAIVEMDGPWVKRIIEKPKPEEAPSDTSSLPLYVFTPRILDYLPEVPVSARGEYELQDAIQMVIERDGRVGGVVIDRRLTLTNAKDLLALNREYLLRGGDHPQLAPNTVGPNTRLITPLHIEQGTVIGTNCTIGPNVYIERDCWLGDNVMVHDAVLLRGASVPDGTTIASEVVA